MDKKQNTLEARLRQIRAMDRNALDIYSDLAEKCDDPDLQKRLRGIAKDEARHILLDGEVLSLLGKV